MARQATARPFPDQFSAFMRGLSMPNDVPPLFVPVGDNAARPFGMSARERACRLAANAGFECADAVEAARAVLLGNMAYAWDPAWLKEIGERPRSVLTLGGKPVLVHVPAGEDPTAPTTAIESARPVEGYDAVTAETAELTNSALRKRERPFVLPLDP